MSRTAAAEIAHGTRSQQQSINRLSALRVKLDKEARRVENKHRKAEELARCHEDHKKALAEVEKAAQRKAELRKAKMDAHAAHVAENPGAKAKMEECKLRNAESGHAVREARVQADQMLEQRNQYYLEQNMQMAEYVRQSTKEGIEKSRKESLGSRERLAEERKQQSKANSSRAEAIALEQKKIKADKAARVQALRENCRDKADRLAEERRQEGVESRERRAQDEEMLMQREAYFQDLNRARHDEVKGRADAAKVLMNDITQERQADTMRMKQEQAAKQAKLNQEKEALQLRRREKTIARRQDVADRARKSVNDLKESKRSMVEKDRSEQASILQESLAHQEAYGRAIQDEEQRLMDQLASLQSR